MINQLPAFLKSLALHRKKGQNVAEAAGSFKELIHLLGGALHAGTGIPPPTPTPTPGGGGKHDKTNVHTTQNHNGTTRPGKHGAAQAASRAEQPRPCGGGGAEARGVGQVPKLGIRSGEGGAQWGRFPGLRSAKGTR